MYIPELRFPSFTGEWEQYKLGDLTEIKSATRVHRNEWQSSGVPFYRTSDIMALLNGTDNKKAYISQELYEKLCQTSGKLQQGDLLITGGGSVGIPYIVPNNDPLYTKDADLLWIKNSNRIDPYFLYTYFFTEIFRNYLMSISHIGTIAHYTIEQAKATLVCIPSVSEQKKIANFFSALDDIINQTQAEVDAWEKQKQGMMQKLFSQEIRFKADDGSEYPEWEEKALGDIASQVNRKTDEKSNAPVMMISQGNGFIYQSEKYSRENAGQSLRKYILLRRGEFAYNHGASKAKPYGITYMLTEENEAKIPYVYHCFDLHENEDKVFWNYALNTTQIDRQLKQIVSSGVRMDGLLNISFESYMSVKILRPCYEEQQKIAACLSAFDSVIDKTKKELEAYKQLKKGLMQEMFV